MTSQAASSTSAFRAMSTSTIDNQAAYTYQLPSLDRALDILPGVAASNSGGSRNEQLLFVRGFDRFQVPLTIDGIRVYLPADNRLDFSRFLTADLSQVQVAKGYVSVLNGPGALGGTINLVTRRPEQEFEADARAGLTLGGSGSAVTLDVSDFCCNEYIDQMVTMIRRSWDQNQGVVGSTTMQFTILRNGGIQSPQVEKSSGFVVLDNAAMRALQLTRLPPLPAAFENPTLTVHLRFDYQR